MPKTIAKASHLFNASLKAVLSKIQGYVTDAVFTSAGLTIGSSSKPKVKIANTVYAYINGVFVTKTTAEIALTTACNVANGKVNVLILSMDSAGTVTVTPGTVGDTLADVVAGTPPSGNVVIGFVIINPTGTGNFVGGTTDLDDATVAPGAVYVNTTYPFNPAALTL